MPHILGRGIHKMLKNMLIFPLFAFVSFQICSATDEILDIGLELNCCTIPQPPIVQMDVSQPVRSETIISKNVF